MAERVCCLYRVSTTKQVDHDAQNQADIPMQRIACRKFAEEKGWTIVDELQETGVSGFKVRAADRDQLQKIKADAAKGKFDILLVYMFDRLGRKAEETPFVVEWFVKNGIRVWSSQEGEQRFDCHADRLTNYIRFWQADGESQKTSMRTKTALAQMVQEGRFRGGITSFGYQLIPSGILNKRKHEVKKLAICEEEAKIVQMMFNLCVGSGYGKTRLAAFLNDKGITTRDGKPWHDATVRHILHNVLYTGVLRSGESYSEPFEELQIISPSVFEMARQLMDQRKTEHSEKRAMPLNTKGQSLLAGNVFCGHCGGRLVLTTSGKTGRSACGEALQPKRIRYSCYNKTRHRKPCDGQTGYTMHILDDIITETLHQVFQKMKGVSSELLLSSVQDERLTELRSQLQKLQIENSKADKEYTQLKGEVIKSIQGKSKFSTDMLSELVDTARDRVLQTSKQITELTQEIESANEHTSQMQAELERIISWSEIFDGSAMEVKKMIVGYMIPRVIVHRDYKVELKLSVNVEQFLQGIDSVVVEQIPA